MVGRKADQRSASYDFFECVVCRTVISYPYRENEANEDKRYGP
jgi:hypothetical protein